VEGKRKQTKDDDDDDNDSDNVIDNDDKNKNKRKKASSSLSNSISISDRNQRNITWHSHQVSQSDRWKLNPHGHAGSVLWFTGLSGSGKSTIANLVEGILNRDCGCRTYLLDGDNIRHGLCSDLGFAASDRTENIRRVGEVCKLMSDTGIIVLAALVSPYRSDRDSVRDVIVRMKEQETFRGSAGGSDAVATTSSSSPSSSLLLHPLFVEIHVNASLVTCEGRDPKGLYKMARVGKIKNFTGIDDPYEEPLDPEIKLDANTFKPEQLANQVVTYLKNNGVIRIDGS